MLGYVLNNLVFLPWIQQMFLHYKDAYSLNSISLNRYVKLSWNQISRSYVMLEYASLLTMETINVVTCQSGRKLDNISLHYQATFGWNRINLSYELLQYVI